MSKIKKSKLGPQRRYQSATEDEINHALLKISSGELSITKCSKIYGIAKGTLMNRIHNKHNKDVGAPKILTNIEEKAIVDALLTVAEWGFPFNAASVRNFAKNYLDIVGRKIKQFGENNLPVRKWLRQFLLGNKDKISLRKCHNLKISKSKTTYENAEKYFQNLKKTLHKKTGAFIAPEKIFKVLAVKKGPKSTWFLKKALP